MYFCVMERKVIKQNLFKILIKIIKYYPFILSVLYLVGSLVACYDVETKWRVLLCKTSFLSLIVLLINSFVLGFCIRHRMPLYFIFLCNVVDFLHTYVGIEAYCIYIYISLFILLYFILLLHYVTNCKASIIPSGR